MLLKQRRLSIPRLGSVFWNFSKTDHNATHSLHSMECSWVGSLSLKRVARPDLENERHRDTSLRLTIHELKNLPSSKRYFCDICLDRKLYARTTSKLSKETVLWGEFFDLNNLSELNFITINLYREAEGTKDSKRRKPNKSQNQLVAYLTIAVTDLTANHESHQWLTMRPASMLSNGTSVNNSFDSLNTSNLSGSAINRQSSVIEPSPISSIAENSLSDFKSSVSSSTAAKRSISLVGPAPGSTNHLSGGRLRKGSKFSAGSDSTIFPGPYTSNNSLSSPSSAGCPQIRLAIQYQSVEVLPLSYYDDLRKLVLEKSVLLVEFLEPLLTTKKKADTAKSLVHIHEKAPEGDTALFLTSVVNHELNSYDDFSLLFRSNSIGSKAVECYIKLVGTEYLQKLFREFIDNLTASPVDLEVDPSRLLNTSSSDTSDDISDTLLRNQMDLANLVKLVWNRLQASLEYFPENLRETLASIRDTVEMRHGPKLADQLVSSCLFLRYICPALHGPALFGLISALPDDKRVSRNLTLLAKVIQTIANFSAFEAKENYMRFMNDYVISMQEEMHVFLRAVSSTDSSQLNGADKLWIKRSDVFSSMDYNCHDNIDLGYELSMLHRNLFAISQTHKNLPKSIGELNDVLASIQHMHLLPSLRRSASGMAAVRSSTSTNLEQSARRDGKEHLRFHSTGTPPVLDYYNKQALTAGFYNQNDIDLPVSAPTPASKSAHCGTSSFSQLNSPFSYEEETVGIGGCKSNTACHTFFGDAYEFGGPSSEVFGDPVKPAAIITSELPPITEGAPMLKSEAQASAKVSFPPPRPPASATALRVPNSPPAKGIKGRSTSLRYPSSKRDTSFPSPVQVRAGTPPFRRSSSPCSLVGPNEGCIGINRKWPSGLDMRSNQSDVVTLSFPPPPPLTPFIQQQARGASSLSGSSTNIRMGTRAIRISRERDLSGTFEDPQLDVNQLSTVPVILQCADVSNTLESGKKQSNPPNEYDTTSSSDLSHIPEPALVASTPDESFGSSNQPLYVNNVAGNAVSRGWCGTNSSGSQSNAREATVDTDAFIPTTVSPSNRQTLNSSNDENGGDPMSRAHNFLFGGVHQGETEDNVYQNFQRPSCFSTIPAFSNGDTADLNNSHLEALENRLRTMEENLNKERKDMQYVVASNIRLIDSQERCINELVNEIKLLKMARAKETSLVDQEMPTWTSNNWS